MLASGACDAIRLVHEVSVPDVVAERLVNAPVRLAVAVGRIEGLHVLTPLRIPDERVSQHADAYSVPSRGGLPGPHRSVEGRRPTAAAADLRRRLPLTCPPPPLTCPPPPLTCPAAAADLPAAAADLPAFASDAVHDSVLADRRHPLLEYRKLQAVRTMVSTSLRIPARHVIGQVCGRTVAITRMRQPDQTEAQLHALVLGG